MELNDISGKIVDAAVNVHIRLGPGLFEEVYKQCLLIELRKRDLEVKPEVYLPICYDGHLIDMGYRLDLLVELEVLCRKAHSSVSSVSSVVHFYGDFKPPRAQRTQRKKNIEGFLQSKSEVIVELKAVNQIAPIHKAQLLTYLKLAKRKLGLLINFNVPTLPEGIVRLVN